MKDSPKIHQIEWDLEKVQRFWNFRTQDENAYFSKQVGVGIYEVLKSLTNLQGRVVDYGCGPGFLLDVLLARGIACEGLDLSSESVEKLNARQYGNDLWRGAKCVDGDQLPLEDNSVDLLICCETLEHILNENLKGMLSEMSRVIKSTGEGRLFLTVPHNEDLSKSLVCCPECGCQYHRVQHLRNFTPLVLSGLMEQHGFETILCQPTNFWDFQKKEFPSIGDLTIKTSWMWFKRFIVKFLDCIGAKSPPPGGRRLSWSHGGQHLFWFGKISSERKNCD